MRKVDVIVVGSGFAGSIMAMILRQLGRTVALIEKGKHPRFAIGESSTPLTNLLLEELAGKYNLPDLATFSKWGTWQSAHPEIACGLKRGFAFYKHEWDQPANFEDRTQQLLVAASPNDRIADTHWYRPDFDAHLARSAQALGVELYEECQFTLREQNNAWHVEGSVNIQASFLIDASGPRGCLFRHFQMAEEPSTLNTQALFAHFESVAPLAPPRRGRGNESSPPPYPIDDAAVHHIFDGGWIWVLRFNNGITSAGVATRPGLNLAQGEPAWHRLLDRLPTLKSQFANARATTPFFYQPNLSFRIRKGATGPNWAMLPSAMGFVDPLFSTGFVLTLLGISRLAEFFQNQNTLREYEERSQLELDATFTLVEAAYQNFADFKSFAAIARNYFAAAIWSETMRRLGKGKPSFLLADTGFGPHSKIDAYDLAGLLDESRRNWHPALASDLFANAWKIPATRAEIEAMLRKCGFDS